MRYDRPVHAGTFLRRYKRFFADVRLDDGTEVTAHCANTGAMTGLAIPGAPCRVTWHDNPRRKLAYSLEQLYIEGGWVMVNTARPNRIVEEAVEAQRVPQLSGYAAMKREPRVGSGKSRLDLLLTDNPARRDCYVEIKSVTLVQDGVARFPDAVTTRGARHLEELIEVVKLGHRGVLFFHLSRGDGAWVEAAHEIDPAYAGTLVRAVESGVEVMAYRCELSVDGATLGVRVPVRTS